jgi:hypothetical protein
MSDDILLSTHVSIKKYREMERARDVNGLADFLYERLSERYIVPVTTSQQKNGFAMMACACLLIETIQCFRHGWKSSNGAGPSGTVFQEFFASERRFGKLKNWAGEFHSCVRCGILHQGETKDGWRISRSIGAPFFHSPTKTIQATKFLNRLDASLREYCRTLKGLAWHDDLWRNFRRKMNSIIANCEAQP